jgi:hypothetical protein
MRHPSAWQRARALSVVSSLGGLFWNHRTVMSRTVSNTVSTGNNTAYVSSHVAKLEPRGEGCPIALQQ